MRLARRALVLGCCLFALPAGSAAATSGYAQVLHAYETQGTVAPCQFSARTLQRALKGVDVYGQQYFADFTDAIQTALAQRAAGQCNPATPLGEVAGSATSDPSLRVRLPAVTASTGSELPLPLLALLVLGLLAVVLAVVAGIRRRLGYEGGAHSGGSWRQLWGEAAWRSEGWLAEQRDRRARSRARSRLRP